jgi:hydroxymethylbilane synthase
MTRTLVIGSRGSKLALWQAEHVKAQLQALNGSVEFRIDIIKTTGDVKSAPLSEIGGKGVFTKEIEDALSDGRIDIAVHSLKDLPTLVPAELQLAAISEREDPRDAILCMQPLPSLQALPSRATIGTSSPRRMAQLRHLRSDLVIEELRGNVDTRIRKLDEGQYDAIVLACAGLRRLGLAERIGVALNPDEMVPAVGQGALGIETRAADNFTNEFVRQLDHLETRLACTAERSLLLSLGGGCQLPIAGHAVVLQDRLKLTGLVSSPDGSTVLRDSITGLASAAEALGRELSQRLIAMGANSLLRAA